MQKEQHYDIISHTQEYITNKKCPWFAPWTIMVYSDVEKKNKLTEIRVITPDIYTYYCEACSSGICKHTQLIEQYVSDEMDKLTL